MMLQHKVEANGQHNRNWVNAIGGKTSACDPTPSVKIADASANDGRANLLAVLGRSAAIALDRASVASVIHNVFIRANTDDP